MGDALIVKSPYRLGYQGISTAAIGLGACAYMVWSASGSAVVAGGVALSVLIVTAAVIAALRVTGLSVNRWTFDDSGWYRQDELHRKGLEVSWADVVQVEWLQVGGDALVVVHYLVQGQAASCAVPLQEVRPRAIRTLVDQLVAGVGAERISPQVLALGSDQALASHRTSASS